MTTKAKKKRIAVVDRKFLNDLANKIYNSKTKKFLRLCDGVLQNGPDPSNKKRSMHCGLGELYYEMTGVEPNVAKVSEDDVISLAVTMSNIGDRASAKANATKSQLRKIEAEVKKLDVKIDIKEALVSSICDIVSQESYNDSEILTESLFQILYEIPETNDDGCCNSLCTPETFKLRSKRVAAKFREAAKLLR